MSSNGRQISLYSNPGKFYHALALLIRNQEGDKATARQLLQEMADQDLEGSGEARQWLKKRQASPVGPQNHRKFWTKAIRFHFFG